MVVYALEEALQVHNIGPCLDDLGELRLAVFDRLLNPLAIFLPAAVLFLYYQLLSGNFSLEVCLFQQVN